MRALMLVLRYEFKAFINYVRAKPLRLVGLMIGLILVVIYTWTCATIILSPYISRLLISNRESVLRTIPLLLLFADTLAFSGGFSLVTTVRKNQKKKIDLFLSSPLAPSRIIWAFLLVNAVVVVLLYVILMLPPLISVLLALNIGPSYVMFFIAVILLGIIGFAFLGCSIGLIYGRVLRRKSIALSITALIVVGVMLYVISTNLGGLIVILMLLSRGLSSPASPFEWQVSIVLEGATAQAVMKSIAICLMFVAIIISSVKWVTNRYTSGIIISMPERHKFAPHSRILYLVFGREIGGLLRKELKIMSREPALMSAVLSVVVINIAAIASVMMGSPTSSALPIILGLLVIILSAIPPLGYLSTSLASEGKRLAILLSSPIDPAKILRAKMIVVEASSYACYLVMLVALLVSGVEPILILFIMAVVLDYMLVLLGVSALVCVKFTNLKAENPRRALRPAGALVMLAVFYATLFSYFLLAIVAIGNTNTYLLVIPVCLVPVAELIRRKLYAVAGNALGLTEATEYM